MATSRRIISHALLLGLFASVIRAQDPAQMIQLIEGVQANREGFDPHPLREVMDRLHVPGDGFTRDRPVTPRELMSHTSGTGDGFGFPGYAPSAPLPTLPQILDGLAPSNVGKVRLERSPLTGYKYSGGGVTIEQLALSDTLGKPFPQIMRELVLEPIGMTNSTYEQPLPAARDKET